MSQIIFIITFCILAVIVSLYFYKLISQHFSQIIDVELFFVTQLSVINSLKLFNSPKWIESCTTILK